MCLLWWLFFEAARLCQGKWHPKTSSSTVCEMVLYRHYMYAYICPCDEGALELHVQYIAHAETKVVCLAYVPLICNDILTTTCSGMNDKIIWMSFI